MRDSARHSLSPEIVARIDSALSQLERTFPFVSRDPQVKSEVRAAVSAALASLDTVVPEATRAATLRAMTASALTEAQALTGPASMNARIAAMTDAATRRALEDMKRSVPEEKAGIGAGPPSGTPPGAGDALARPRARRSRAKRGGR